MNVFITSCETGEGAWNANEKLLKRLYELSDKQHSLVDNPESADIVLVGNVRGEDWGKKTLENELINRYPGKCFSLSDADAPIILHHGIYTSGTKSILSLGRVRTGSYTIYTTLYRNQYVQTHLLSEENQVEKKYLFSFIGRNASRVRDLIFRLKFERDDTFIQDSSAIYDMWDLKKQEGRLESQKRYYDVLLRSKFSLCPRGGGTSSTRLFESMQVGVAPIIISDAWIFPKGPKWNDFSIVLKEKDVKNVEKIVESHEGTYKEMGLAARKAFETYFADDVYFNYVVDNCTDIMRRQLIPEALYWKMNPAMIALRKARAKLTRGVARLLRPHMLGASRLAH